MMNSEVVLLRNVSLHNMHKILHSKEEHHQNGKKYDNDKKEEKGDDNRF